MGEKKRLRKKLAGQQRALAEHLAKIEAEKAKPNPNWKLIETWEKTVANIKRQIAKLERRLKR
jgi:ubiquinone biosynthesis protein UbiJ